MAHVFAAQDKFKGPSCSSSGSRPPGPGSTVESVRRPRSTAHSRALLRAGSQLLLRWRIRSCCCTVRRVSRDDPPDDRDSSGLVFTVRRGASSPMRWTGKRYTVGDHLCPSSGIFGTRMFRNPGGKNPRSPYIALVQKDRKQSIRADEDCPTSAGGSFAHLMLDRARNKHVSNAKTMACIPCRQ